MNKTAIKNFAVWARRKLISDITYKAGMLGITDSGIAEPLSQSTKDLQFFDIGTKDYAEVSGNEIAQRKALVDAIKRKEKSSKTYKEAFEYIVEEVAYTWFNRLIAIRFMEVNDYLPSGIRVLSSENSAKNEPDFVTTPFDTDLEFTSYEQDRVMQLKDENKLDELFRMLFIKQCNKLHEILPELFEKTDDYTELLLTLSFTDKDGVVYHLVHDIDEDDFNVEKEGQVEIIGWMYQYYISEKHDEIINIYKGTVKKDDIPAATQLFTTDWVVRYMVDNSLGRYWIERNPESKLAEKLEFFVTPKNGEIKYIDEKIDPTELTFFDPCMGSGHILVYAFDVLMEIYRECGYTDRDAALNIVQYNLHGLDIDERAYQLAYFAVMMKARSYNRRALTSGIFNNIAAIEESNELDKFSYDGITDNKELNAVGEYLIDAYRHAKEIGSLQTIEQYDYKEFAEYLSNLEAPEKQLDLFSQIWCSTVVPAMLKLTKQADIMSKKYAVVCTNPPYMGKLESHLKDFVVSNYKEYSGDLFSVFMYRNFDFCKKDGYSAFMTPFVWMFIKTYEQLRNFIINNKSITSLIQMEYSAFEEATVPICAFVLKNGKDDNKALCFRLSEFKGGMEIQKQKVLEAMSNKSCGYFYEANQDNFSKIPGSPVAYWVSKRFVEIFESGTLLGEIADSKQGIATADNNRFLRLWYEVNDEKIKYDEHDASDAMISNKKWFPYNKGGEFRKWYGNNDYVVNWENNGCELKNFKKSVLRNPSYYFKECFSWSLVSSSVAAFRYKPQGHIFDVAGMSCFSKNNLHYLLALCNTNIIMEILKIIAPTINYQCGDIANIPVIIDDNKKTKIAELAKENIEISKVDWDSFETSWDFKKHPLITHSISAVYDKDSKINDKHWLIENDYKYWKDACENRFKQLKSNEEELNRIFIDIYGLQDELTPEVEDKDVTVHYIADTKEDAPESMRNSNYLLTKKDIIKSLISYAVGCMFGRYSIYKEGLIYAGGDLKDVYEKYEANMEFSQVDEDTIKYKGNKEFYYLKGQDIEPMKGFKVDADNIIPITDEPYFKDDIVGLFEDFVEKVYGKETLEENLDFIAAALGNRGNTSREVIRNYFLNDFIKDHIKTYQKRPIYWLFDSGKQNGFKALCYMHRYNADTIGNMRIEYLHRVQRVYEKEIERMQEIIDNSTNAREVSTATKRKDKLTKQLKETKDYDEKVAHLALSRIDIDLDDGVKVNYEKVQTAQDGRKLEILAKI